jgi:quinol monooxygenase YgiN
VEANEWCAVAHIDIGPPDGPEAFEEGLSEFVEAADAAPGTSGRSALRPVSRPNHFEVIGRFASEVAYLSHLVTPSNLVPRKSIAPVPGSPYEDRVHGPRGPQNWPAAVRGDFVVIFQIEARPQHLAVAECRFDELAAVQLGVAGING